MIDLNGTIKGTHRLTASNVLEPIAPARSTHAAATAAATAAVEAELQLLLGAGDQYDEEV